MPRFQDIVWPIFDDLLIDTDYYPARAKARLAQEIERGPEEEETSYRPTAREQIAQEILRAYQIAQADAERRKRRRAQRRAETLWVWVAGLMFLGICIWIGLTPHWG